MRKVEKAMVKEKVSVSKLKPGRWRSQSLLILPPNTDAMHGKQFGRCTVPRERASRAQKG